MTEKSQEKTSETERQELIQQKINKLESELKEEKQKRKQLENKIQQIKPNSNQTTSQKDKNISRRDFLKKAGLGIGGLAALGLSPASALNVKSNDFSVITSSDGGSTLNEGLSVDGNQNVSIPNGNLNLNSNNVNQVASAAAQDLETSNSFTDPSGTKHTGQIAETSQLGRISQTVTSYSDLPLSDRTDRPIIYVENENDYTVPTALSPVKWVSLSDYTTVASTIPNSVVDDFEDNNLNEYTTSSNISIGATEVVEGSYSLELSNPSNLLDTYSLEGNGLNYYPKKGDKFSCLVYDSSDSAPTFNFGLYQGGSGINGYAIGFRPSNNDIIFYTITDGAKASQNFLSFTISTSTWYEIEVQWHDGSGTQPDNTFEITAYEVDTTANLSEELGRTSEVNTKTFTNSVHTTGRGIGFADSLSSPSGSGYIDRFWHLGDVE